MLGLQFQDLLVFTMLELESVHCADSWGLIEDRGSPPLVRVASSRP